VKKSIFRINLSFFFRKTSITNKYTSDEPSGRYGVKKGKAAGRKIFAAASPL
jgi:hypothetical protein